MSLETNTLLFVLGSLVAVVFFWIRERHKYFQKRGIKYLHPPTVLGSTSRSLLMLESQTNTYEKLYRQAKDMGVCGFFQVTVPGFLITDPAIVNKILTRDFNYFRDHGPQLDFKNDPLQAHIFNLCGDEWKTMRNKLLPTFSSGKLKTSFSLIEGCSDELLKTIEYFSKDTDIEIKEAFCRYTVHVIGSFGFGIELGDLLVEDNPFIKMGKKVFQPQPLLLVKFLLIAAIPLMKRLIKLRINPPDVIEFFTNLVKKTFQHRTETGYVRKDFIQLLLELREKGSVSMEMADSKEEETNKDDTTKQSKLEMTDEILTAQAFVFFVAGFETTASAMSFTSYFLSKNPEIQDKLRKEIREVKSKNGGLLTYDSLSQLHYLENCISESLRMYAPLSRIIRVCTKDYVLDDGTKIDKGIRIHIPAHSLHHDPAYFNDPEKYRPERFDEDTITPGTYMPFGDGPRICIGKRFALMSAKLGIAKLIDKYQLEPSPKTIEPIQLKTASFITIPKHGLFMRVTKLD